MFATKPDIALIMEYKGLKSYSSSYTMRFNPWGSSSPRLMRYFLDNRAIDILQIGQGFLCFVLNNHISYLMTHYNVGQCPSPLTYAPPTPRISDGGALCHKRHISINS